MFAELTPPPGLANWLGCLAFVVVMLREGGALINSWRGKPGHPPNEQLDGGLKDLKERINTHVAENDEEHRAIFSKIGGVERGAQANLQIAITAGNESREKIHHRLNEIAIAVGEIKGELHAQRRIK